MTDLRRRLIFGALLFAAVPSFAAATAPVDWSGCAVPVIGTDKHAVVTACAAILDHTDLAGADRERALITRGRAYHMLGEAESAIRDFDAAITRASIAVYAKDYVPISPAMSQQPSSRRTLI